MQTIELPFPKVEAVVVGRLVRVGRPYGRAAAEFSEERRLDRRMSAF
jgi:hypothetical protein